MKKVNAFIFLFSAAALSVSAQKKLYYSQNPRFVEWIDQPTVQPVPPEYANESAVMLLHDIDVNYKYEGRDTNTFYTRHDIIKVLDERGIEMFNKVRIPVSYATRYPLIKARTISPSGKVHDIAKDMIKVTKDETGRYMISIAMENVEKNAEIEYIIKSIHPYTAANEFYYQFSVPIAYARFEMTYPRDLSFEMKSHNGFPQMRDSLINGRRRMAVQMSNIPALEEETNSFNDLHRMAIEYRAPWQAGRDNERSGIYDQAARDIFATYYKFSEKDRKAVNRFLTDLGVHANGNERENIKKIEQGIKSKITLYQLVDYNESAEYKAIRSMKSISRDDVGYDERRDILDTIITKKATSSYGYVKLFAACLYQAGIRFELGLAGDRRKHILNPDYETMLGLNDYLFYFPGQKMFLDPLSIYLRYPVISEELVGGRGLFCAIPPRGEVTGNLYNIRRITPLPVKESGTRIAASVNFSKEMDPTVDIAYSWYGYAPTSWRTALPFIPKDKMKERLATLVPFADKPDDIEKYTLTNEGFDNYYDNKPLELYASVHPGRLVSKAGNRYLFRLGPILGPYTDLYAENNRKSPVDILYPYYSSSTVTINIPKGYKVLNPEVIRTSADYLNGNLDAVISFNADYKLVKDKKGDKLVVTVNEYYNQLHFATSDYERYRKVVNTAADFNKVTLLLADNRVVARPKKKAAPVADNKAMPAGKMPATAAPAPALRPAPVANGPIKVNNAPPMIKVGPAKK